MKPWSYFSKKCLVFIHCKGVVNILTLLLRRPSGLSSFDSVLFIFLFEQEKNTGMPLLFLAKTMIIVRKLDTSKTKWILDSCGLCPYTLNLRVSSFLSLRIQLLNLINRHLWVFLTLPCVQFKFYAITYCLFALNFISSPWQKRNKLSLSYIILNYKYMTHVLRLCI